MQTSCSIYQHNISPLGNCMLQCIKGNTGGVTAHLLLNDRNANTLSPNDNLLDSCCAECISSTYDYLMSCLLELICKLTYCRSLAYSVDTNDHYNIRTLVCRNLEALGIYRIILRQQITYLVTQYRAQLIRSDIFVTGNAFLNTLYYPQCRVNTYITCHKDFLEIVKHVFVNLVTSGNGPGKFLEETTLGLLQPLIQCFLFLFIEKIKKSHIQFSPFNRDKDSEINLINQRKRSIVVKRLLAIRRFKSFDTAFLGW